MGLDTRGGRRVGSGQVRVWLLGLLDERDDLQNIQLARSTKNVPQKCLQKLVKIHGKVYLCKIYSWNIPILCYIDRVICWTDDSGPPRRSHGPTAIICSRRK